MSPIVRKPTKTTADDLLYLLSYCSKHRDELHSIASLAEATGIPSRSLQDILNEAMDFDDSYLATIAWKYNFKFKVIGDWKKGYGQKGRIIDVVWLGPKTYTAWNRD